ncbi:MAG: DUF4139 domain-containing protein [Gemmatimonadales bacterium]
MAGVVALLVIAPRAEAQTSLSIYSDGRVVVRQTLPRALERGVNQLALRVDGLDPVTLFSPDTAVSVLGVVVRPASDQGAALAAAIGQTLSFVRDKGDTVRATIVRTAPPQYRLPDGRLLLSEPGVPLFPADLVRTAPEVALRLEASAPRPRTQLAYVLDGATWEAVYQVVLGRDRATVAGMAAIRSTAVRAESAGVQLVAGSIARARRSIPPPSPVFRQRDFTLDAVVVTGAAASTTEEAVGETHVYEVPGRVSLAPGEPVAVALFPRGTAAYVRELIIPGVVPWRGWLGDAGSEPNRVPVQVWYTLKRTRGTAFGERPLPAGTVQLYHADTAGRVQLIGEARNAHTAAGRDLRMQSGEVFDLTAERVQVSRRDSLLPMPRGFRGGVWNRRIVTATFRVTVTSAKAEAASVDVRESRYGSWKVIESSVPPERLSAHELRFRLPVPAGGEATLTYTVQIDS